MTTGAVALEERRKNGQEGARSANARLIVGTIVLVQAGWLSLLGYVGYRLLT